MNRAFVTLFCLLHSILLQSQTYQGPVPAPTSSYGSWGTNEVATLSFPSPLFAGKNVDVFYPKNATTPRPTIFFSHGFGGNQSEFYSAFLRFFASKGFVTVFSPYQTSGVDIPGRYDVLWEGFKKAFANYPNLIDTSRVGFAGHSFGGGASFEMMRRAAVDNSWGKNGRFIASYAPWYLYDITPSQLQNFPADVKLLVQVYEDDVVNDHRIAIDAFENIGIADSEKDFVLLKTDQVAGFQYEAGHAVPSSREAYDAYDAYVVFRLTEALADYTFNNNATAKNIALGSGGAAQVTMPTHNGYTMKPLIATDNPSASKPESFYMWACSDLTNPRRNFCTLVTTPVAQAKEEECSIYPNPARGEIKITGVAAPNLEVFILSTKGQVMLHNILHTNQVLDVSYLPSGMYIIKILAKGNSTIINKKLVIF